MVVEIGDELRKKIKKGKENLEYVESLLKEISEYGVPGYDSKADSIGKDMKDLEKLEKSPEIYVNPRIKEEVLKKAVNSNLPDLTVDGIEYRFEKFPETSTQEDARKFVQGLDQDVEKHIELLQMVPTKPPEKEKFIYKNTFNAVKRIGKMGETATLERIEKELKGYEMNKSDIQWTLYYCEKKGMLDVKKIKGQEVFIQKTAEKSTIGYIDVVDAAKKIYARGKKPTREAIGKELKSYGHTFEESNLKNRLGYSREKGLLKPQVVGKKIVYPHKEALKSPSSGDIFKIMKNIKDDENRVFEGDVYRELEIEGYFLDRTKIKRRLNYLVDERGVLTQQEIEGKKVFIVPEEKRKKPGRRPTYTEEELFLDLHKSILISGEFEDIKPSSVMEKQGLKNEYKALNRRYHSKDKIMEGYEKRKPKLIRKVNIPVEKIEDYLLKVVEDLENRKMKINKKNATLRLRELGKIDEKDVCEKLKHLRKIGKLDKIKYDDRRQMTIYSLKEPEEVKPAKPIEERKPSKLEIPSSEKFSPDDIKITDEEITISKVSIPRKPVDSMISKAKDKDIGFCTFFYGNFSQYNPAIIGNEKEFTKALVEGLVIKELPPEEYKKDYTRTGISFRRKLKRR